MISQSQSVSLRFWQIVLAAFCSSEFAVWEAPASLKLSIEVIICLELKQSYCEILESVPSMCKVILKFSCYLDAAVPLLETDNLPPVFDISLKYALFWFLVLKKNSCCTAFWDQILAVCSSGKKSVVGQEIGNFWFFWTWSFNPTLKQTDKLPAASLICLGVLTKAM